MKFKLKKGVGNHAEKDDAGNVVIYKAIDGAVIESKTDLAKRHPDKFERVTIDKPSVPAPVQKAAEEGAKDLKPEPLGKNVTEKFSLAAENDFKVFYKRGKGYMVTESVNEYIALNDKKLKKADVEEFIDEFIEPEDFEDEDWDEEEEEEE